MAELGQMGPVAQQVQGQLMEVLVPALLVALLDMDASMETSQAKPRLQDGEVQAWQV